MPNVDPHFTPAINASMWLDPDSGILLTDTELILGVTIIRLLILYNERSALLIPISFEDDLCYGKLSASEFP